MNGVTISGQAEILPEGTVLRLLRDRILLRPLDWTPSRIISVVRRGRPLRGVVHAVGPGRLYRRYRAKAGDSRRREFVETGTFIPTQLRPGDIVELGGLNIFDGAGYNFPQVVIGTETFLICQEQDVCFVHEPSDCLICAGRPEQLHESTGEQCPLCSKNFDNTQREGLSEEHLGTVQV